MAPCLLSIPQIVFFFSVISLPKTKKKKCPLSLIHSQNHAPEQELLGHQISKSPLNPHISIECELKITMKPIKKWQFKWKKYSSSQPHFFKSTWDMSGSGTVVMVVGNGMGLCFLERICMPAFFFLFLFLFSQWLLPKSFTFKNFQY